MVEISSEFDNEIVQTSSTDEQIIYASDKTVILKQKRFGKWQVVKRISPEYAFNPIHRKSLEQEFEIVFQLDHPNIIRFYDKKYTEDGVPYIIMEYVDGCTLRDLIESKSGITKKEYQEIFNSLLSALHYLHQKQIYHLDIKPENIIYTHKDGIVKLIDFGFAITGADEKTIGTTRSYIAPEFSDNAVDISGKTDMYSFAKTMLELAEAFNIFLSYRQRRILAKSGKENLEERITVFDAQKIITRRNGFLIFVPFIIGLVTLLVIKDFKIARNWEGINNDIIKERREDSDEIAKQHIDSISQKIITAIKNNDIDRLFLENVHYSDQDSLFIIRAIEKHKRETDSLKYVDFSYDISESLTPAMRKRIENERCLNAIGELRDSMLKSIQKYLEHYCDENEYETYDYYYWNFTYRKECEILEY